jgi:Limiting CO2-inducible proteins B/C beta carbonyic anhydrases
MGVCVRVEGNLFILFAPHIGISASAELGKYSRVGQTSDGAACGAAVGAYKHCCAGNAIPTPDFMGSNPFDYQMCYIISEVSKRVQEISSQETSNGQQAELAKQMYEISKVLYAAHYSSDDLFNCLLGCLRSCLC